MKSGLTLGKCAQHFKLLWLRKLIGKPRVPYNRGLRIRGSSHPEFYDADLSLPAAESNAFRFQSEFVDSADNTVKVGVAYQIRKREINEKQSEIDWRALRWSDPRILRRTSKFSNR
ncbi:MAG TPA: hypothetical protein VG754_03865 [Verrucomicrobiae bacterium]|nr:hypothetical protein [Verrucomicrobiae bacterium]